VFHMEVVAKRNAKIWMANATAYHISENDTLKVVGTYLDDDEVIYVVQVKTNTAPFAVRSSLII
jgi:hypothetical protein